MSDEENNGCDLNESVTNLYNTAEAAVNKEFDKTKDNQIKGVSDNALQLIYKSGGNESILNNLLGAIDRFTTCDAECLLKRKENRLKELWKEANLNEELAKVRAIMAARSYYNVMNSSESINSSGSYYRERYVIPSISLELIEINNNILEKQENLLNVFTSMSSSYETENKLLKQIVYLVELKEKELFNIIKKINEYEKIVNVDIRKNFYEFNDQQFYNSIKFYVQIIYFAIIAVYIFFGDFMSNKRYSDYKFYIGLIIYILIPFVIKYIIAFIVYLYTFVLEYFNLKDPIYSYNDIIRADNIEKIYTSPVPNKITEQQNTAYLYNKYVQ